jgi:hypothetical protein
MNHERRDWDEKATVEELKAAMQELHPNSNRYKELEKVYWDKLWDRWHGGVRRCPSLSSDDERPASSPRMDFSN